MISSQKHATEHLHQMRMFQKVAPMTAGEHRLGSDLLTVLLKKEHWRHNHIQRKESTTSSGVSKLPPYPRPTARPGNSMIGKITTSALPFFFIYYFHPPDPLNANHPEIRFKSITLSWARLFVDSAILLRRTPRQLRSTASTARRR